MKTIRYTTLTELKAAAKENNIDVYETSVSYSFRIFENGLTKYLHIMYK